jgi:hypothetical protein
MHAEEEIDVRQDPQRAEQEDIRANSRRLARRPAHEPASRNPAKRMSNR